MDEINVKGSCDGEEIDYSGKLEIYLMDKDGNLWGERDGMEFPEPIKVEVITPK